VRRWLFIYTSSRTSFVTQCVVPSIPGTEFASLQYYAMNPDVVRSHGPFGKPCLLCEYIRLKVSLDESQSRVVVKTEHFVALVPSCPIITPSYRDRETVVCEHPLHDHQAI
jgi:hypothetical protein